MAYFFDLLPLAPLVLSIRKSLVPQTGQVPSIAGRPFFIVTSFGSLISRFSRHLTQYASTAAIPVSSP